ncbi:PAS domain S-box protein [Roseomonas indoligenes]|uniref:PAS domain S-box protein n=1 Tax=Roseomonas indoligenes TaxID=2820811 RepID=A0A940MU77_9PROT|nr:PAS domain S-box protein [Pararoseomonas indoligenes]MBP0494223.1 PAS domain S-box protein [Pararoseomonas indoligenes]
MFDQPFGQAVTSEDGRFLQVNRALCELLWTDAPALLARSVRDITHPADWADNAALLHRLRDHGEPFTIVKRCFRADGTTIWVQAYVSILHDAAGRTTLNALIRPVLPEATLHHGAGRMAAQGMH